jgi:hypothetical protein
MVPRVVPVLLAELGEDHVVTDMDDLRGIVTVPSIKLGRCWPWRD